YFSHFRSRVTDHDWDVIKVIASLCDPDHDMWANSNDIRSTMKRLDYKTEGWRISKSIGDLKHAGLIEARDAGNQATYRIPVGLFQIWLKQVVTSLLVSRDLQRED
ncbi:MAG TPA: hypothetical protein VHL11_18495, partial [Phototrophicaceae bacterium]|nr:hypothetical protein [Phototrophicaceae bacterium]